MSRLTRLAAMAISLAAPAAAAMPPIAGAPPESREDRLVSYFSGDGAPPFPAVIQYIGPKNVAARIDIEYIEIINGNATAILLAIRPLNPLAGIHATCPDAEAEYTGVRTGDRVAAFGAVYVATVEAHRESGRIISGKAELVRVTPDRLPAGLAIGPTSLAVPLFQNVRDGWGHAVLYGRMVQVRSASPAAGGRPASAEVGVGPQGPTSGRNGRTMFGKPTTWATVGVGDWVRVGGQCHKVLAIVPRDEEKKVAGWVELSGDAVGPGEVRKKDPTANIVGPAD